MPKPLRSRVFLGLLSVLLVLSLSGCSLGTDVWTLLRTPHLTGEQEKVQTALDAYIKSTPKEEVAGGNGSYVLKYPKSGDYRSAFILKDMDSDGKEEAIAFYSRGPEGSNVHINLLRQDEEDGSQWKSVSDIEGASADIEKIRFGDLDGDGIMELLTGWNIDNVRDKQFVLYSTIGDKISKLDSTLYSTAVVGDLTQCGHDNLLLIYSSGDKTTARLWTMQRDPTTQQPVLSTHDSITIDGSIQQFGNCQIGKLSETQNCAYVDAVRPTGGMVTEIIYWDGSRLHAPFYENNSYTSSREASIPSADVDGDGAIEWPSTEKLDGYSPATAADMLYLVTWSSLKLQDGALVVTRKFTCIMNMTDGYYLRIDDKWKGQITATFDSQRHILRMYTYENQTQGKEILALHTIFRSEINRTAPEESDSSQAFDTHEYQILQNLTDVRYDVWYAKDNPYNFSLEQIRYMFGLFNKSAQ